MNDKEIVKGSKVVATWGAVKEVMTVALKPKMKGRIMYLTLEDSKGVRQPRPLLAQWWRLANDDEIGNKDENY